MSTSIEIESRKKSIRPEGKILNDNGVDVDHLCHVVYAEALALQIETIKSPVAVGIFSRWGSGKSFLLKHVQNLLERKQKEKETFININIAYLILIVLIVGAVGITIAAFVCDDIPIYIETTLLAIFFLFLIACIVLNTNDSNTNKPWYRFSRLLAYSILTKLPIRENKLKYIPTSVQTNYALEYVKDFKKNGQKSRDAKKCRRFIYVNYNAWQYAGCDVLWAGIVTAMAERIEHEFGVFTTRVFRSLVSEIVEKPIFGSSFLLLEINEDANHSGLKEVIKKGLNSYDIEPVMKVIDWERKKDLSVEITNKERYWIIEFKESEMAEKAYQELQIYEDIKVSILDISNSKKTKNVGRKGFWKHFTTYARINFMMAIYGIFIVLVTSIALLVYLFTVDQAIKIIDRITTKTIVVGVLSLFPAGLTVLFGLFRLFFALFDSHRRQIIKAIQGAKKDFSNQLGFMNNIKKEIQSMTDLIHAIELSHNIEYKVVITIDDLDRVPLPKVKSVLEAINILLSDRSSPFICLIAVDSRIANSCFTASVKQNEISPTVNGYEYMKKIINLPFCLPEVDDKAKKSYIGGLIDESDKTEENYATIKATHREHPLCDAILLEEISSRNDEIQSAMPSSFIPKFRDLLFACRELMHTEENLLKELSGNPRNIKRIFNITSMTVSLIVSKKKREKKTFVKRQNEVVANKELLQKFAKQLLYWIVLTDQWPYRISYMLVVIDECSEKDETSLVIVYDRILEEEKDILYSSSHDDLLSLDYDAKALRSLLSTCESFLTVGDVKKLLKYTTNLDRSIMKSIYFTRDKNIQKKSTESGFKLKLVRDSEELYIGYVDCRKTK